MPKRGYAYQMIGNYGAAISDETEALRLQQSYSKAYFTRGISGMNQVISRVPARILTFFSTRPYQRHCIQLHGGHMFMNQDYKGSLENYNQVVRLDPKYPDIYTNRGMMRH